MYRQGLTPEIISNNGIFSWSHFGTVNFLTYLEVNKKFDKLIMSYTKYAFASGLHFYLSEK
jgi:hypothetical protein